MGSTGVGSGRVVREVTVDCELIVLKTGLRPSLVQSYLRELRDKGLLCNYPAFTCQHEISVCIAKSETDINLWTAQKFDITPVRWRVPDEQKPMPMSLLKKPNLARRPFRMSDASNEPVLNRGYVYLIQKEGSNLYKIGRTKDPKGRLARFEVVMPFPIEPIHVIKCENYRVAEHDLHAKYAAHRKGGEWFELSDAQVAEIKAIKEL